MRIILGTRGSELARAQVALVEGALRAAWPEMEIAVEIIRTSGDEGRGVAAMAPAGAQGRKGMFTSELEAALRDGRIDVAVHSAKDLPSEASADLEVCAALERGAIEDVLITKSSASLTTLPAHATIATGSVRRQRQLCRLRADLKVIDLRGNVPTRLRKLTTNPWDGIILARAGLERLGFDCKQGELVFEGNALHVLILSTEEFLPAGGQGIVALQTRADDEATKRTLAAINHAETFLCLRGEREFLHLLGGDCGMPVGVIADWREGALTMRAQLFEDGHAEPRSASAQGTEAMELAAKLLELING